MQSAVLPLYRRRIGSYQAGLRVQLSQAQKRWRTMMNSRRVIPRPLSVQPEFKTIDTQIDTAVNNAGVIYVLNGCTRGTDMGNRVGRRIQVKSVYMHGTSFATNGTGIDQSHRFCLFWDKTPNYQYPAVTDVLATASPFGFRNLDNRSRFIPLWDKWFNVCNDIAANQAAGDPRLSKFDVYKRLNQLTTFGPGDDGDIGDIGTGALYFICVGSVAAGPTAGSCIVNIRVRFIDA